MEHKLSSNDASSTTASSKITKLSKGSHSYLRKVSDNIIDRPRKLAKSFRMGRQKSTSVDDLVTIEGNVNSTKRFPDFTKVRSLPRDAQPYSQSLYNELIKHDSVTTNESSSPFEDARSSDEEVILASKDRRYSAIHHQYSNLTTEFPEQKESTSELNNIREALANSKRDVEQLKAHFESFKTEFRDTIDGLKLLIKEDEDRYTKLCYQLHNVTDLHQTQLQYLQSIVEKMEENTSHRQDSCILDLITEQLKALETRILRL